VNVSIKKLSLWTLLLVLSTTATAVAAPPVASDPTTALKDYVAKPDDSYGWVKRQTKKLGNVEVAELTLTSQTWRGIPWKHQLFIFRPSQTPESKQALIPISGGDWKDELAAPPDDKNAGLPDEAQVLAGVVDRLKTPVAILSHVPQQPIFDGMVEDEIISYTFEQYLKSGDAEWPLLFPMVKSAVRAMDAVEEFSAKEWNIPIETFTVTGASKRGWTTWLTGAADPRATAIVPIVIDTLNMSVQMKHQLDSWGKYSEQIEDYTRRGIQAQAGTERGVALNAMVDPYNYRADLTQPKLIINGTNDRYWTLDALNNYWNDLAGEKYVLYVPNNGHGVNDFGRLLGTIGAFHEKAAGRLKFPNLTWKNEEADDQLQLAVKSDLAPEQVVAWIASSPTRDFREAEWKSYPTEWADGEYRYHQDVPAEGYTAMFGEAVYRAPSNMKYYLSTNVEIGGDKDAPLVEAGAAEPVGAGK
jgi:PhoPQ-activated pathogenicity-related protein